MNEKEELQNEMTHLLMILRDFLSNLHQENKVMRVQDLHSIEALMRERFNIIESFTKWSENFSLSMRKLSLSIYCFAKLEKRKTFEEELNSLGNLLKEEDVELLLMRTQLQNILKEIEKQSHENLSFSEHFKGFQFNLHPLQPQVHTPKKVAVALMETETQ